MDSHNAAALKFTESMERELETEFADFGYSVMKQESQKWDVGYSLARGDTDGSVEVFFGPVLESQAEWRVPYELIHEGHSFDGLLGIPKSMSAGDAASFLFQRLSTDLTNRVPLTDPTEARSTASKSLQEGERDAAAREDLADGLHWPGST